MYKSSYDKSSYDKSSDDKTSDNSSDHSSDDRSSGEIEEYGRKESFDYVQRETRYLILKKPKDMELLTLKNGNHPFENYTGLSFLQRDKYIFEFAYLLKKNHGDIFKENWCQLRKDCMSKGDINYNPSNEWDNIDLSFITGNLTFDIHNNFVMKVISPLFNETLKQIEDTDKYLKKCLSSDFIINNTKNYFKDRFMVNKDLTSYNYNPKTKLYSYQNTMKKSLSVLKSYLVEFEQKTRSILRYFNDERNKKIIYTLLSNLEDSNVLKEVLENISIDIPFIFNNAKPFEIAYKDRILDLKTGNKRERTNLDYYTTSVNCTYMPKYNVVPPYIRSVFGDNKDELKRIQILLGSLITGDLLDSFILFNGKGANSKSKLIIILKEILGDYQENIDYEKYISKKEVDTFIDLFNIKEKRIIGLDDMNHKTFLKDETRMTRLLNNNNFNFIGCVNKMPSYSDMYSIKRRIVELYFPFTFVDEPLTTKEKQISRGLPVNKDQVFTWLVKGSILYSQNKKISDEKISNLFINVDRVYNSDDGDSEIDEPFIKKEDDEEEEIIEEELDPIISFVKENTYSSITGRINKKDLHLLYCEKKGVVIDQRSFNKVIRETLHLEEKKSNSVCYWMGIRFTEE